MNSFDDTATNGFINENLPSYDFMIPSDLPTLNSSVFYQNFNLSDREFTCPSIVPNSFGRYVSMILFTVVCIIGLFGNSLVIYVVLR